jgi:Concanavalin A-like lectin/glucanases superfamily
MKTKIHTLKSIALTAALVLNLGGIAIAQEEDTNATTVAYWKFSGATSIAENPVTGVGIPDLATNIGQGVLIGSGAVPASVDNLWILGPISSSPTFSSTVPPASLFNADNYFNAGPASWDCGADEYSGSGGEVDCDNGTYGNEFDTPSFTEEVVFKTDYTNDATLGTVKQTLVWNHQSSSYGEIQLNESATENTNDIGCLLFWGWNVVDFPFVRITAAQNGGRRFDDGQWHYVSCRYNGTNLTMDILVVNQDGSRAESTTYIGSPLNPGGSGSQGPLIIGNDENGATPFDGLINQIRYSSTALPDNQLLANVVGCNPITLDVTAAGSGDYTNSSASTNIVTVGGALNIAPVYWVHSPGAQLEGGPAEFRWLFNSTNVVGQTNMNLNLFPITMASAGVYQLVASTPCGDSVTSAPVVVQVNQVNNLARWSFESTDTKFYSQATVEDNLPGFTNGYYDLITFNNQPNLSGVGGNGEIPLTNGVPPTSMFIDGNNAGTNAFNPAYLAGQDGVVFYPLGSGPGDPFDFQGSFSLEAFFKTYGDQSTDGTMEVICQGSDGGNTFRYGINLNQAAPGALCFKINNMAVPPAGSAYEDTNAGIQSVVISNQNYADGAWHYLLAKYDVNGNTISLAVANADGSGTNATLSLPPGYSPLPNSSEGNLFVGRYRYPWNDDNRNFAGAIDEVQVSSGLITPSTGQLGFLPGAVITTPVITGISESNSVITIRFTGSSSDPASAFTVVAASTVDGNYSPITASIASNGGGNFQATVSTSGNSEFYRIKR